MQIIYIVVIIAQQIEPLMKDSLKSTFFHFKFWVIIIAFLSPKNLLLVGMKFSNFTTSVFSVPWFTSNERSCHTSFNTLMSSLLKYILEQIHLNFELAKLGC